MDSSSDSSYNRSGKIECFNYPGISLLIVARRVYERVLENRRRVVITLQETQADLRSSRLDYLIKTNIGKNIRRKLKILCMRYTIKESLRHAIERKDYEVLRKMGCIQK